MRLDDSFWVKLYKYKSSDSEFKDITFLQSYIAETFKIDFSFVECEALWEYISVSAGVKWLSIPVYGNDLWLLLRGILPIVGEIGEVNESDINKY